jgi:hypothetical protein
LAPRVEEATGFGKQRRLPSARRGIPKYGSGATAYTERSQPILIMVSTQSSGRYDRHSRMFSAERAASASLIRPSTSIPEADGSWTALGAAAACSGPSMFIAVLHADLTV